MPIWKISKDESRRIASEYIRQFDLAWGNEEALCKLYAYESVMDARQSPLTGLDCAIGSDEIADTFQKKYDEGWSDIIIKIHNVRIGDNGFILLTNTYSVLGSGPKAGAFYDGVSQQLIAMKNREWVCFMHLIK